MSIPAGSLHWDTGLTPSMASEIVSMLEPNIIIPMNYSTPGLKVKRNPANRFLKEMGIAHNGSESTLKLSSNTIPEETEVILLEPQQ